MSSALQCQCFVLHAPVVLSRQQHFLISCYSTIRPLPSTLQASVIDNGEGDYEDGDDEDDDEDEDDEILPGGWPTKLESPEFKNFPVEVIKNMEEKGKLVLQPFYQRGYKWDQEQASLWIESILVGFPCIPEVMLLQTEDNDGRTQYATFDGRQRLTSIIMFIRNERGDAWKTTRKQKKNKLDTSFALEDLTVLTDLEGKTFKELTTRQQNKIDDWDVRCAIIPSSWPMRAYIEFFKRIQGGGTPMSNHELRRAISRGPFTDLLDDLVANSLEVKDALGGYSLPPDNIQELLLRYYVLLENFSSYGKVSLSEQNLVTMKSLNREMSDWKADERQRKRENLTRPLVDSLKLLTEIFHKNEPFRRPAPLLKIGKPLSPGKLWVGKPLPNKEIWLCQVYCFSRLDKRYHPLIRANLDLFRSTLIDIMQMDPSFTGSLRFQGATQRIAAMETRLRLILEDITTQDFAKVPLQTRIDLIANARASQRPCPICNRQLSALDDHLHIDHIHPRSKGGTTDIENLQVVHKTCNLRKSNKVFDGKAS